MRRGKTRTLGGMVERIRTIYELIGLGYVDSAWAATLIAAIYVATIFYAAAVTRARIARNTGLSSTARAISIVGVVGIAVAVAVALFPVSMMRAADEGLVGNWWYLAYAIALFGLACLLPTWLVFRRAKSANAT